MGQRTFCPSGLESRNTICWCRKLSVSRKYTQLLTLFVEDILVNGLFLARSHLIKEALCFNETGSQSETAFFFFVLSGEKKLKTPWHQSNSRVFYFAAGLFHVTFVLVEDKRHPAFKPLCLNKQ